ncbi:unnamed protein product, partial [Eruca vesicaria subsp. sativa]|nr:unnamed protein product [Eruca vesicaria subsp. sativa]
MSSKVRIFTRDMVKKANQDGPRRSKHQMPLDVTHTDEKTLTEGQKKLEKLLLKEDADAWTYVKDPADVIENEDEEHNDQDIEEEDEEAEAEKEKEKEKEKENTEEAEKEKEKEKENTEKEEEDSSEEEVGKEHEERLTD